MKDYNHDAIIVLQSKSISADGTLIQSKKRVSYKKNVKATSWRKHMNKAPNHIDFANIVLADDIDNELAKFYSTNPPNNTLIMDFAKAKYIDIAALVNCIALLRQRAEEKLITYIGYPESKRVRDFLKVWGFPEAVQEATGIQFNKIIMPGQADYLYEKQTTYTGIGNGLDALEYNPDLRIHNNFFGFTCFSAGTTKAITPEGEFTTMPRIESKRWTGELVREVLKKHLPDGTPQDEFARVVIYEAMSNAVRHPNAKIIASVSVFTRKKMFEEIINDNKQPSKTTARMKTLIGNLRICIWDDGESIAETLSKPLREKGAIRITTPPPYMCDDMRVSLRTFNGLIKKNHTYSEYDTPDQKSEEYELLLASFYPGVTRSAYKSVAKVEPYCETKDKAERRTSYPILPGMGLYALKRTAIEQFLGRLILRSGKYRLAIESTWKKTYRYSCKITEYPGNFPPFKGNLLVINLPIRRTNI